MKEWLFANGESQHRLDSKGVGAKYMQVKIEKKRKLCLAVEWYKASLEKKGGY